MNVVVIGGGPAGILAGISASEQGNQVTILEKMNTLGKKLCITGKGRCNITSSLPIDEFIKNIPGNGKFLYSAFKNFTNKDIINLLEQEGLKTKVERGNRVFPVTDRASDVRDALIRVLKKKNVKIITDAKVEEIEVKNGKVTGVYYILNSNLQFIGADKVILATGGKSYPLTGSTGDGYRLAIRTENIDTNNTINAVIPGKTLNEVAKILEDSEEIVNITFTPNHILFNMGDTKVISRLLEGEFIKYDALLPKEHKLQIEVDKQTLQNGIERASLMAKEGNSNLVKFDITDENIVITSNSQLGKVREEVTIKLQGDEIQIAFNSKYLLDVLKNMEEDKIELRMTSSISPCIIRNKNNDLCEYLVLPVRIAR